jgi:hypothetical protein
MDRKVALVTGITGQDGSYLAEFLLEKGYEVSGGICFFFRVFVLGLVPPVREKVTNRHICFNIHLYLLLIDNTTGSWDCASFVLLQHWSHRSSVQGPSRDRC